MRRLLNGLMSRVIKYGQRQLLRENIMRIECEDAVQFMNAVESSVQRGLKFTAYYETLTIEYTGGY